MNQAVIRDGGTVVSVHTFDSRIQAEGFVFDFNYSHPFELHAALVPDEFYEAEVVVLTLPRCKVPERLLTLASYFVKCACGRTVLSNGPLAGCPTCKVSKLVAV